MLCLRPITAHLAADDVEEVVGADLAALENKFQPIELRVGVSATERAAGLEIRCPGECVESELLDRVR